MNRPRVAVLGGGISGVVLAGELGASGLFEVDLFERESHLGGLHRSYEVDGTWYDIGTFVFHSNHSLFQTFPTVAPLFRELPCRFVSLTSSGRLDQYPMTVRGLLRNNGRLWAVGAVLDLCACKVRYCRSGTVPGFAKYYLGGMIYSRSGLKAYIERLYAMADAEVDIEFARKRLGLVSRWGSWRRTLASLALRRETALRGTPFRGQVELARPAGGFGVVYQEVGAELARRGVNVRTAAEIRSVRRTGPGFEVDTADASARYDRVVSTVPISTNNRLIGRPPPRVEYMKLLSLFYRFPGAPGTDATVLFNFSTEGRWKRATLFSRYYGPHRGDGYMTAEVTLREAEEADVAGLRGQFERHVQGAGLFPGGVNFQGFRVTDHAYPVYRREVVHSLTGEKARLTDWGLLLVGRQAEFDYVSSSDAAASACRVARELIDAHR